MSMEYDLIVIGAGPGGYVSAAVAAGKGMKTAVIEKEELGGTCLNHGCIPTKTIMHSTELYAELKAAEAAGIHADGISYSMAEIQNHKQEVLEQLRSGIAMMLKKGKVDFYQGTAKITDKHTVIVGSQILTTDKILICTGSRTAVPTIPGMDLDKVVTSDDLLDSTIVYKRLVIIGGGVIGMELASIYSRLGTEVVVIEALDRILVNMDKEFSQSLKMLAKKRGTEIHTKASVKEIRSKDKGVSCIFTEKDEDIEIDADAVLVATGRRPNTEGLLGSDVTVDTEKGRIIVNENYQTSVPNIYAAGDVIGGIQLAHVASAEAVNAVCHMAGEKPAKDINVIPSCIYTSPEIASVGITPEEAKAAEMDAKTVKYPMSANGKSLLSMEGRGFIKVTADASTGKILGAQMMCARATDMIAIFAEAIACGLTKEQMSSVIYPHPTFSEGIGEAVELF
ncbi:MAG: dihydrolipoyl dehydrogenase [Clostridiales bacterium]|nr:dihydrolipoyl dehydrogenase [Clostridiales bacterium]